SLGIGVGRLGRSLRQSRHGEEQGEACDWCCQRCDLLRKAHSKLLLGIWLLIRHHAAPFSPASCTAPRSAYRHSMAQNGLTSREWTWDSILSPDGPLSQRLAGLRRDIEHVKHQADHAVEAGAGDGFDD